MLIFGSQSLLIKAQRSKDRAGGEGQAGKAADRRPGGSREGEEGAAQFKGGERGNREHWNRKGRSQGAGRVRSDQGRGRGEAGGAAGPGFKNFQREFFA